MKDKASQEGTPVIVWVKALAIALLLLGSGFVYYASWELERKDKTPDPSEKDIVDSNIADDEDSPDILIMGSSLTKCAFSKYNSLQQALDEKGQSFKYEIITRNSVTLGGFSAKIPEIQQEKPQYLLLESNIVCVQLSKRKKQPEYSYGEIFKRYYQLLRSGSKILKNYITQISNKLSIPVPPQKLKNKKNYWKSYKKQARRFGAGSIHDFPEWNNFFESARQNGIHVIIIEMARSMDAKELLPPGFQDEYEALLQQYSDTYGIEIIRYPAELPQDGYYRDAAHLNSEGAALYSQWFVDLLINKQNNNQP